MVHAGLKGCFIVALGSFSAEWNQRNVKKWVAAASGTVEPRVTENTTHLVTTPKEWEKKGAVVHDALKRTSQGQNIHIVSYDWLEDSLRAKARRHEKKYMLSTGGGKGGEKGTSGAAEAHSTAGLMKQLYEESTALTPAHKKSLEQQQAAAEQLVKDREAERMKEFQQSRMSLPEQAAVFKKGAQRAKLFLINDNHHIYQDSTGFHYDITLTKVDTRHNTNERWSLVIFESNTLPYTYAFCAQFSGTRVQTQSNTIVSIGSNWATTFLAFKKSFKEKTSIEWDDRVRVAEERHAKEKEAKAKSKMAGTYAGGQLGVAAKTVEELNNAPFQYHPPNYGPKGEFQDLSHIKKKKQQQPEAQQQRSPSSENGSAATSGGQQEDFVMSGGNGDAPRQVRSTTPVVMSQFGPQDVEKLKAAMQSKNPDGTDNLEPLDPFREPFDFGKDFGFDLDANIGFDQNQGDAQVDFVEFGAELRIHDSIHGYTQGSEATGQAATQQCAGTSNNEDTQLADRFQSQSSGVAVQHHTGDQQPGLGSSILGKRKEPQDESQAETRQKRGNCPEQGDQQVGGEYYSFEASTSGEDARARRSLSDETRSEDQNSGFDDPDYPKLEVETI